MNTPSDEFCPFSRRELLRLLALSTAAYGLTRDPLEASEASTLHHSAPPELKMGSEQIVILVYPQFTALDALGPHYALAGMMGASVRFVAKTKEPVMSEGASSAGICVRPHLTFDECPANLDLLLVPGGVKGTLDAIEDAATRRFVSSVGRSATRVGSVCTGSLLLGAAGLLQGRKATSHWQLLEVLRDVGAQPVAKRVVFDGPDRVTAAGVSAGLDLGFELVRLYRGDFYAKGMQLLGEYDPRPPFPQGGNPRTADKSVVSMLNTMHEPLIGKFRDALRRAKAG